MVANQDARARQRLKAGGELVPTDLVPDELWGSPSVLRRAIDDASWATLPIEDAWGPFFPDVAEKDRRGHFYPPPLSDEFWRDYGEPLSAFLEAATLFSETLQNLDAEARDDSPQHELDVEHRRRLANRNFFSLLFRLSSRPRARRPRWAHARFPLQVAPGVTRDDGLSGSHQWQAGAAVRRGWTPLCQRRLSGPLLL